MPEIFHPNEELIEDRKSLWMQLMGHEVMGPGMGPNYDGESVVDPGKAREIIKRAAEIGQPFTRQEIRTAIEYHSGRIWRNYYREKRSPYGAHTDNVPKKLEKELEELVNLGV